MSGIPERVKSYQLVSKLLEALEVKSLYPVQEEAIRRGALEGRNLVISAPTASGKTLAAMMSMAARLEAMGGRAFYIAPLRSIALEKYRDFKVFEKLGYTVRVSVGDYERGLPGSDVVISTYEKLDSSIRSNPSILNGVSVLVVDEIHYVGDPDRGPLLESLIARILDYDPHPQIIALSATIPNAEELARWLDAELVVSDWRPVPLLEGVYDGSSNSIIYSNGSKRRVESVTATPYIDLVRDINLEGGHALVFVQSRRRAVQMAKQASRYSRFLGFDERKAREYAIEARNVGGPSSIREEISELMLKGVSYHHAGLNNELRIIVEEAFRDGALAAVYATPTLAAGVNLPARRVIVAEYYRFEEGYRRPIGVYEYKQLAGRAGRPGLDEYGEAVIIPSPSDDPSEVMEYYIFGRPEPVESKLAGLQGLRHSSLGLIASGAASRPEDLVRIHKKTLYARQKGSQGLPVLIERAVEHLIKWGLIVSDNGVLKATPAGYEASRFYVDPAGVPKLRRIIAGVNGELSDTHLLFALASTPDMPLIPVGSRESERILDKALDCCPELLDLMEYGSREEAAILKSALILRDWIEEVPEDRIIEEYDIWPGDLYSMVETGRWLAAAYSRILEVSGWPDIPPEAPSKLRILSHRLKYGVKAELLPLVAIPGVGRVRARRLYEAGYKSLADLASADPRELERIKGIGSSTIAAIMEFLGRSEDAKKYKLRGEAARKGLLAYMED